MDRSPCPSYGIAVGPGDDWVLSYSEVWSRRCDISLIGLRKCTQRLCALSLAYDRSCHAWIPRKTIDRHDRYRYSGERTKKSKLESVSNENTPMPLHPRYPLYHLRVGRGDQLVGKINCRVW